MAYLELKNVSYTYPNGFEAVKNINLSFEKGESVAIIGQNGAGKTTTVKLMNGLLKPTKGTVRVAGKSTGEVTTATTAKKIGYVFQNPDDQIFQETIFKEIAFGLKSSGMSVNQIDNNVKDVANLCGLTDVLDEHPYNLPFSKRKFVTIAAVIAMNPEVIILDEPTAGQDRKSNERLAFVIKELKKRDKTVITITHDMEFVVKEFQRVIVFAEKEKQAEGTPKDIFWDQSLLTLSRLKQPYICQLANKLGLVGVMTREELQERITI